MLSTGSVRPCRRAGRHGLALIAAAATAAAPASALAGAPAPGGTAQAPRQGGHAQLSPDRALAVCGNPRSGVHMCAGGFVRDFADAETVLSPLFNGASIRPVNNNNVSQLDDPAINRAMRDAQALTDPQARARAWAAIDRRVTALAPAVAIGWPRAASIRSTDVAGVPSRIFPGNWDLSFTGLR
jgi:hypothetical protein